MVLYLSGPVSHWHGGIKDIIAGLLIRVYIIVDHKGGFAATEY